jgi:uncharacterized protein
MPAGRSISFPRMTRSRRVAVTVKPGSKSPGIEQQADTLIVRVRERAVEGAANAAVIRALATYFDVPPSSVVLVRGERSRVKFFDVPFSGRDARGL